MAVRVTLDSAALARVVEDAADASLEAAAGVTVNRARINLAAAGRRDTGALAQSIQARRETAFRWTVGSFLHYAIYQEEGVRGPIYPRRAKFLRFKPKGATSFVFARSVRGFPGAHYLRDAAQALTEQDFVP